MDPPPTYEKATGASVPLGAAASGDPADVATSSVAFKEGLGVKGTRKPLEKKTVDTLYITSRANRYFVSESSTKSLTSAANDDDEFVMKLIKGCWERETTAKAGGAMTKKRMRTTKRQLKGKRGLKSRVKSRVKTSRS